MLYGIFGNGFFRPGGSPIPPQDNLIHRFVSTQGITETSGRVSGWADQVGSADLAQTTDANRPILIDGEENGGNSVFFARADGRHDQLAAASGFSIAQQNFACYIIGRQTRIRLTNATRFTLKTGTPTVTFYYNRSDPNDDWTSFDGTTNRFSGHSEITSPSIIGLTSASTGSQITVGPKESSQTALPVATNTTLNLGHTTNSMDMEIKELLFYSEPSDSDHLDEVRDYAQAAYGIPTTMADNVVICGDSLNSPGSLIPTPDFWPNQFFYLFPVSSRPRIVNAGLGGTTALVENTNSVGNLKTPLEETWTGKTRSVCVMLVGHNDMISVDAPTTYARIETLANNVSTNGADRVLVCTIPAAAGARDATWQARQAALNILLRADFSFADRLVDLAADSRFQDPTDTDFYLADEVHHTKLGATAIAELVKAQYDLLV